MSTIRKYGDDLKPRTTIHVIAINFDHTWLSLARGSREPWMGANVVRRHAIQRDLYGEFAQVSGSPIDSSRPSRTYRT
jgi:hypothetical protein